MEDPLHSIITNTTQRVPKGIRLWNERFLVYQPRYLCPTIKVDRHVTQTIKEEVSGLLVSPSIFFPLFYPSGTLWVSRTLEIIFTERDSIPGVPFVSLNMVYNSR